ncbi:cell wall-binding repeat-containing protein [Leifsonia sp. RAF41]|uniref:cell wall-binding repeat-containing protein n=1 Tax=Leifsonia sp. RAF41 TaxID=3233056 RepID=UPI003F9A470C
MNKRVRRLFAAAAIAVAGALGVTVLGAAPASAVIAPIVSVGGLDTMTVEYGEYQYSTPSALPAIHFTGWAGDLNHPNRNGHSGDANWLESAWIQVTWQLADGSSPYDGIIYGHDQFAGYRPDVHAAYPSLGSNQGFDFQATPPATGHMMVCLHVFETDASFSLGPSFGCRAVTVPSAPPAYRPTIKPDYTASPTAGTTLNIAVSGPSGGQDTVEWYRGAANNPDTAAGARIGGANTLSLPTDVGYSNRTVWAIMTTRMSDGTVIRISLNGVTLRYPNPIPSVDQVAGDDRYSTSVATSQRAFPNPPVTVPVAYIASGATFPDALSAGAAAAHLKGTLLLTPPTTLDPRVASELVRLHPATIVVAGGPATVSDDVLAQLSALSFTHQVKRISGADRFEVSRNVIEDAFGQTVPALYLATGNNFPDALTAGAAGAVMDRPVLLTNGSAPAMDAATQDALARWGTTQVMIVGGPASVTSGVANGIPAAATVQRSAGADRYDVAAALSTTLPASDRVYLTSGAGFADALTTAALAGATKAPLLLSTGTCATVNTMTTQFQRRPALVVAVGGSASQDPYAWEYPCGR